MTQRSRKFAAKVSAAAGSLAALTMTTSPLEAGVVHNTNEISVAPGALTNLDWDIDGNGTVDIQFNTFSVMGDDVRDFNYSNRSAGSLVTDSSYIQNLPFGFEVGPTLAAGYGRTSYLSSIITSSSPLYGFSGFSVDTPGFVGFQFNDGVGTRFGWASLEVTTGNGLAGITISEWAYEDMGNSISVGEVGEIGGGTVPEPSTLALFAMGAAGLSTLRLRRRRSEAPSEAETTV